MWEAVLGMEPDHSFTGCRGENDSERVQQSSWRISKVRGCCTLSTPSTSFILISTHFFPLHLGSQYYLPVWEKCPLRLTCHTCYHISYFLWHTVEAYAHNTKMCTNKSCFAFCFRRISIYWWFSCLYMAVHTYTGKEHF